VAFYQGLILLTTLGAALFARRWQFYAVVVFWLGWTVVMVFVPWLLALQLTVVAVSGFLGTKVLDWRESRAVDARPDPDLPQAVGRVFMITTKNRSLGALDFQRVLRNHGITVARTARLFSDYGEKALPRAIDSLADDLRRNDVLCIIRGGGDTSKPEFATFHARSSCEALRALRTEKGVLVVTGLAHESDTFPIDECADFAAYTPTHAAFKVAHWKTGRVSV